MVASLRMLNPKIAIVFVTCLARSDFAFLPTSALEGSISPLTVLISFPVILASHWPAQILILLGTVRSGTMDPINNPLLKDDPGALAQASFLVFEPLGHRPDGPHSLLYDEFF